MGGLKQFAPTNHFDLQNEDVLCNPRNPENPDSKPQLQAPQRPTHKGSFAKSVYGRTVLP